MIALYIVIGIAVGAVVLYLVMNQKVGRLHVELAKKETEMQMLSQQRAEEQRQSKERFAEQMRGQREQFEEQLKTTKEQLRVLAQQLMDAQAQRLKEENKENMGTITQPLKEAISEMRKAINENTKDHTAQNASLKEQLRLMMESNEVQARLRDEQGRPLKNDDTGKEMQPDVILHYPQGQDAVIDSKVSLVAYQRYVNAEDPEEKERALQDHIKSIRSHVTELARKDYSKYIKAPREAVDFVIMFVPFESSLQLALANDPTLWREAFERKVFITGEQNLLGILHMIHIAWVQNQQAENQEKVFGIAEQLLDRLGDFIQRYNKVGEQLEQARKAFDYSKNKLDEGRQSVVQKGRELIDMGAKENPNRRIPNAVDSSAAIGSEHDLFE